MSRSKKIGVFAAVAAVIFVAFGAWWLHRAESIRSKKLSRAADETSALAENGNAAAEYEFARMYYEGRGVQRNYAIALHWYRKSAEQGYANAEFALGDLYFQGRGVPQDTAEAICWTRKAADQGYAKAQAGLGYLYFNGVGVPQNYVEAFRWYSRAADQGEVDAEHALGYAYLNGIGAPKDYNKAFQWLQRAAGQGDAEAQASLGYMYGKGQGVPQNRTEAYRWYRKSADQGNPSAKHALELLGNNMRWFELFAAVIELPVGLCASLYFLLQGRRPQNRRQIAITLLGVSLLANAGLSLYAFAHYGIECFPNQYAFHIARLVFTATAILIIVTVVLPAKKKLPGS